MSWWECMCVYVHSSPVWVTVAPWKWDEWVRRGEKGEDGGDFPKSGPWANTHVFWQILADRRCGDCLLLNCVRMIYNCGSTLGFVCLLLRLSDKQICVKKLLLMFCTHKSLSILACINNKAIHPTTRWHMGFFLATTTMQIIIYLISRLLSLYNHKWVL